MLRKKQQNDLMEFAILKQIIAEAKIYKSVNS